jgi:TonB-linked SusC/RagA family outer membrane protein
MYKIYTKGFAVHKKYTHKILLVMRLTTLILVAAFMQVSAATLAQRVTLHQKKTSLESVFKELRKQTGYNLLYVGIDIKNTRDVTISVTDQPLENVLKEILTDQGLTYEMEEKTIIIKEKLPSFFERVKAAFASIDIYGRVIDNNGLPIPGVTIKLKDGSQATTSDRDGIFTFKKVDDKAILIISSIGYQTIELDVKADMGVIKLEVSTSKLDEVKVVAYGTTTQRLSVGSMSTVSAAEIERQPVSNVISALQGNVPGLQITTQTGLPGGDFSVRLRGANSLTQSSDPLYIIDGIPFTSTSMTKLVGLNAAGVTNPLNNINPYDIESVTVLKDAAATSIYGARGANGVILITMKKGRAGETKAEVNAYTGIGQNKRRKEMMNTAQYIEMRKEVLAYSGITTYTPVNAIDLATWDPNAYTDWQEELLGKNAIYNNVQASVSSGSGGNSFLLGAGYNRESTVFSNNFADRKISLRFSTSHVSKNGRFNASLSGSFVNGHLTLPPTDITSSAALLPPNRPALIQSNGKLNWDAGNPMASLYQSYLAVNDNLITNASLSYSIIPGLQIKSNFGYNLLNSNETYLNPSKAINPALIANTPIGSWFGNNSNKVWNIEPQINYNKTIGKGVLDVLIGSTLQSGFGKGVRYSATGFVSDAVLANIQAARTITVSSVNDANTKYSSIFARLSYNYQEKYIVDITGRRDGSSRFGPNNRFGNFGAAGLGWVFSKETLVAKYLPFINFGKLRVSYGTVGNTPGNDYNYLSQWGVDFNPYDGIGVVSPNNLFNQDYAWEKTRKAEVGLDMQLFKGRISITADYYRNRSSNQLVNYPLPSITGFASVFLNLGATVENTGWEFSVQSDNIRLKSFQWTTSINFSAPRNKLVEFPGLATSTYANVFFIGQPTYVQRLYHYVDVNPATGLYRVQGANGPTSAPVDADRTVFSTPNLNITVASPIVLIIKDLN